MENTQLGSGLHDQKRPQRNRLDDDSIINSTINTDDSFSNLPEAMMLRILFFLPARDAARTSLLSRTWRRLWSSLPTKSFKFNFYSFQNNYVPEKGKNLEFEERLDKFIKFVDDSLFMIRREKIKIESFHLYLLSCYEHKLQTHTCQWLELVTKNPIKELKIWSDCLHDNIERYALPMDISIAKSLSTLNLKGLQLNDTIFAGDFKFPCLRSLSLSNVILYRETAENLLSSCPLLEEFEMRTCYGLIHLCIPNLPTLKKVYVYRLDRIDLEILHLSYPFLSLEPDSKRIIIASHQLTTLSLAASVDPVEIEIDSKSYQYSSSTVPSILVHTSYLDFSIYGCPVTDNLEIDTVWFIKLQKYLTMFNNHKLLFLTLPSNLSISFNPMEWTATYGSELPTLENLFLSMTSSKNNYEALFDGLLRVCRPRIVSAQLVDEEDRDLVKFLYEVLITASISSRYNSPFGLHGLKEAKILGFKVGDENDLESESLLTLEENKFFQFQLTW